MYAAVELTGIVREDIKHQWYIKAASFSDPDMRDVANDDTNRSLSDCERYTHAVVHSDNGDYVALIGIVKAEPINCHKVLDMRLNPTSNPDYRDEQEIGLLSVSEDIVGAIVALTTEGIIESQMRQVKIFGRGHDMKTFFNLVVGQVQKTPILGLTVYYQAGWLVIERT